MADSQNSILKRWALIPRRLRRAIGRLSRRQLNARGGSEGWTIREYGHHLVEANLVASTIVIAGLGKPGCTVDWSWLIPDDDWMKNLRYNRAPLEPAIEALEALSRHVAGLIRSTPGGMRRYVYLVGTKKRRATIERVLADEIDHAAHHLADIAAAKRRG